jgi:hypothetical protein
MLYQKDPKYAHLPHSEWLKTPDGDRYRQASSQYGNPTARTLDLRPEDRIRDLMRRPARRPVSEGKGPPPGKPPKPAPPSYAGECYPQCNKDGSMKPVQYKMCMRTPDPDCKGERRPPIHAPLPPYWGGGAGPRQPNPDFVFERDELNVDIRPRPQLPPGMTPYDMKGPYQR